MDHALRQAVCSGDLDSVKEAWAAQEAHWEATGQVMSARYPPLALAVELGAAPVIE